MVNLESMPTTTLFVDDECRVHVQSDGADNYVLTIRQAREFAKAISEASEAAARRFASE